MDSRGTHLRQHQYELYLNREWEPRASQRSWLNFSCGHSPDMSWHALSSFISAGAWFLGALILGLSLVTWQVTRYLGEQGQWEQGHALDGFSCRG